MKELEYKKYIYDKASKVKTKEDLDALLKEVVEGEEANGYGKIVYTISACMKATFNYIERSNVGGITGFQASFIGWEMIREFIVSDNKCGMKILDYDNMLYPQYRFEYEKTITETTWKRLQENAEKMLKEKDFANENVIKHWKSIVDGEVPFGYTVKGD